MNYKKVIEDFKARANEGEASRDFLIEMNKIEDNLNVSYFNHEISEDEYLHHTEEIDKIINRVAKACIIGY